MDEFARIATYLRPLAAPEGLGLADDAAWLQLPAGHTLVATKDALVEGVHFLGSEDPADIACKALRVNLSDLAAMGAAPYGYLLATHLPKAVPPEFLARFVEGLREDQAQYDIALFGGDSTATAGPMAFSITALGLLAPGQVPLRRQGAQVGDDVYVSGTLGLGALGLRCLREGIDWSEATDRYLRPEPRLALGQALRGLAHAVMDISDGLVQDAGHLARASGLALRLERGLLPVPTHPAFEADLIEQAALTGGDDYELLFTAPTAAREPLAQLAHQLELPLTRIGSTIPGQGVLVEPPLPAEWQGGWQHF